MNPPAPRDRGDLFIVLAIAAAVVGAVIVPQLRSIYPFTYDELVYLRKVRAYDEWLREGLAQAAAGSPLWVVSPDAVVEAEALQDMHPGFARFVALLPHRAVLALLGREGGARLTGALFLALACACVYWCLRPRVGRWFAAVGALGLASLPRVFGDAPVLALDVPIMAMYLAAALALRRAARLDRWGPALWAGVLAGLALGTKLNAAALVPHLGLWLLIARPPGWKKVLAGALLAPPAFLLCWPWLWHDLPGRLLGYEVFHAHHFRVGVSYLGHIYSGPTTPPAHYAPVMLALTTPLPWLAACVIGLGAGCVRRLPPDWAFMALGLACSVGLLMLPSAARYGGVRLMLPALPFMVMLGTMGAHRLAQALAGGGRGRRGVVAAVAGLLLLGPAVAGCIRCHPYCRSYYTEFVGLRGAADLGMDVTYWGDAFAGAREFMRRPQNAHAVFYASNELATGVVDAHIAAGEIPPHHRMLGRFVTDELPPDADFILVDNHPPMWPPSVAELVRTARPVLTVSRCGVPLLWVFEGPGGEAEDGDAR